MVDRVTVQVAEQDDDPLRLSLVQFFVWQLLEWPQLSNEGLAELAIEAGYSWRDGCLAPTCAKARRRLGLRRVNIGSTDHWSFEEA